MKKIVKNILMLSLTFVMIGIYGNLYANTPDEDKDKEIKEKIKNVFKKNNGKPKLNVSKFTKYFDDNSRELLMKDGLLDSRGKFQKKVKENKKTIKENENYDINLKSSNKVDSTTYFAISTFGKYGVESTVIISYDKRGQIAGATIEKKGSKVTDLQKEKLEAAKTEAKQVLEAYKNENVNLVDLSSDCEDGCKSIDAAKVINAVNTTKDNTLASMTKKVDAAKAKIAAKAAELEAADRAKLINEEEATAFVNNYASQLASFVKNANNMEEVLAMFANNEVEVTVSALNSANKTKTVAEYLNELSKLSNGTYKNNTQLNINVENVELLGTKAIVKVVQNFDGNGVYCDETVKSIELLKENEKVSINKIEVLETKSCK